jgi:hypothetical protein
LITIIIFGKSKNDEARHYSFLRPPFYFLPERPLVFYCDIKLEWTVEVHSVCCTGNGTSGFEWFMTDIWRRGEMRRGNEKGRCLLYREKEDTTHILLKIFRNQEVQGTVLEYTVVYY